jgi:hypothetical protein
MGEGGNAWVVFFALLGALRGHTRVSARTMTGASTSAATRRKNTPLIVLLSYSAGGEQRAKVGRGGEELWEDVSPGQAGGEVVCGAERRCVRACQPPRVRATNAA